MRKIPLLFLYQSCNKDSSKILGEGRWYWFHDFVATFRVHNRSFYMPYCRFLVWGELLDTGSRPSVVDNWFLTNNRFFTSIPKSSKNVSCNFDLWQPGGWKIIVSWLWNYLGSIESNYAIEITVITLWIITNSYKSW